MDWQKQDNEIRKLMEEGDFLPEGEAFDERRTWQKLNAALRPKAKVFGNRFIRITAAACLLGAVSFLGIKFNTIHNRNQEMIKAKIMVESKENEGLLSVEIDAATNFKESGLVPEKLIFENKEMNTLVLKEIKREKIKETNLIQFDTTKLTENEEKLVIDVAENKQIELTQKDASLETENATAKQEVNKPVQPITAKVRVVHYNELNRNNTITPPGFAKSHKSEELLNALVLMNPSLKNQNETLQIKIELTPQLKKSL
jgi:hypothetical protein